MSPSDFVTAGAAVFFVLGFLHLVYSFLDLSNPKRFVPADPELFDSMQKTTIRMRKDAKNYWLSSLGFNFSHSLGLIFYSAVSMYVARAVPELMSDMLVAAVLISVGAIYAVMARAFWFSIPFIGAMVGTGLMATGLMLAFIA